MIHLLNKIIILISFIVGLATCTGNIYNQIDVKRKCIGYLDRAASSNTIELAKENLDKAIYYLESNNITEGYTSIFYTTPDEDIAFWYTNLKACQLELEMTPKDASQLEKSNILMKLRDSLTDNTKNGTSVIYPNGIRNAPNNRIWFWITLISWLIVCIDLSTITPSQIRRLGL